jgi:uncharacterized protein HemY
MGLRKINISTWLPIAMVLLAAVSLTVTSFFFVSRHTRGVAERRRIKIDGPCF